MDNVHGAIFVGQDASLAEVELNSNYIQGTLWLGAKTTLARLSESDNDCPETPGASGGGAVAAGNGDGETGACSSALGGEASVHTAHVSPQRGSACSVTASGDAGELQSTIHGDCSAGHGEEGKGADEVFVGAAAGRTLRDDESCLRDSYVSMRASSTGDSLGKRCSHVAV